MAFINGKPYTGFRGINIQGPNDPNTGFSSTGGYIRFGGTVTASMSASDDIGVYPIYVGRKVCLKFWNGSVEAIVNNDVAARITNITATATLSIDQAGLIIAKSGDGSMTLTLPSASDVTGLTYTIKKADSSATNTVTIARAGTDIIDKNGVTSLTDMLTQGDYYTLVADGSGTWHVVARRVQ